MNTKFSSIITLSKGLILIAFLIVLPAVGFSQEPEVTSQEPKMTSQESENVKRIHVITEEIRAAVLVEDYEKAKELSREKRIRLEIEQAIANEDFDKAIKLKVSLTQKEEDVKVSPDVVLTPEPKPTPVIKEEPTEKLEKTREIDPNYSTRPGFYLEVMPVGVGYFPDDGLFGFDVGLRIGSRFSRRAPKKFRVGFDMQWLNISALVSSEVIVSIAPVRPGIFLGLAINDRLGINYSFNLGPNVNLYGDGGGYGPEIRDFGIAATNSVAFRIKKFGVGLTYHSTISVYPDNGFGHVIGAFVGLRF